MARKITRENMRNIFNRRPHNTTNLVHPNPIQPNSIKEDINDMVKIFNPLPNSRERDIIEKWEKISDKSTMFLSFVSDPPDTNFYSSRITSLVSILDSLGYDYYIVHYKNDREYHQNCCYKPVFIEECINKFNKDIVWIDGDTLLKGSLDSFIDTSNIFDIGLVTYNGDMNGFVASPLFFRNTPQSLQLIKRWASHCTEKIESGICELDHDALKHTILPEFKDTITIKLNWDGSNKLHNGEILKNINSDVPSKRAALREMSIINQTRPYTLTKNDFRIV